MTRRVLGAILAVTALAVSVFAAPLAVGARRLYRDEATTRLERSAQAAAATLAAQLARGSTAAVELPDDAGADLSAYGPGGVLLDGEGPSAADPTVTAALCGAIVDRVAGGSLEVAVPVFDEGSVVGAIRATTPTDRVDDRVRRAWLTMAGLGLAVLGLASGVAFVAARRLTRPVSALAGAARRLGDGDFTVAPPPSGVPELDAVGEALAATSARLGTTLDRERAFSADASHQLRTPLAALRIRLEAAQLDPAADHAATLDLALAEIDRLERTIDELMALARDQPGGPVLDPEGLLDEVERRWHAVLAVEGRPLRIGRPGHAVATRASMAAVRHALDVLVDNANRHGKGSVYVAARDAGGALAFDVTDEGPGPSQAEDDLFRRRSTTADGSGIGLALARSLVEAQGGRLVLARDGTVATFTILLPEG